MATPQSVENITELPSKVLEHIFSYLPINGRKQVSLVCRSWEELAFPRSYLRRVTLQLMDYERTKPHQYGILCNSSRAYRRILIYFGPCDCTAEQFEMVLILMNKFGGSIQSFTCINYFTAAQLLLLFEKIPNVEYLIAGLSTTVNNFYDVEFPVLNSLKEFGSLGNFLESPAINIPAVMPNMRSLGVKLLGHGTSGRLLQGMQLLAPQLRRVEMYSTGYYLDISKLYFPQVEQMKLSGKVTDTDETTQQRFFERFSSTLKVLIFKPEDFILDIVTKRCPLLHTLHMKTMKLGTDGQSLQYLNRLRRLKVLGLKGHIVESMLFSLHPMPSVETFHLHMPDTEEHFETPVFLRFAHLFPNVSKMSVVVKERSNLMDRLFPLCSNFIQLRRIRISGQKLHQDVTASHRTLTVQDLGLLEELTLNNLDVFVKFQGPSENLRRLVLEEVSHITNADLVSVARLYPNLRYLKVHNCREVRKYGAWAIKVFLPDIVLDYDNAKYQRKRFGIQESFKHFLNSL